jgi:hypothetical protein
VLRDAGERIIVQCFAALDEEHRPLLMVNIMIKLGDKSRAICPDCKKVVTTTFQREQEMTLIKRVRTFLVGVCDSCSLDVSLVPVD